MTAGVPTNHFVLSVESCDSNVANFYERYKKALQEQDLKKMVAYMEGVNTWLDMRNTLTQHAQRSST